MNAKWWRFHRNDGTIKVFAAASAALLSLGLLTGTVALFSRDGARLENTVVAERACSEYRFASERANCMASFAASARRPAMARR
jgi:hypothetical protein